MVLLEAITLPILASGVNKGREEFSYQANRYYDLLKPLFAEGGAVQKLTNMGVFVGYSVAFSQACFGISAVTSAITGIAAQRALNEFHARLGADVSNMNKSLEIMVDSQNSKEFGERVFHFADMHSRRLRDVELRTGRKQFTWVYHRGSDWHWSFNRAQQKEDDRVQHNSWLIMAWACMTALLMMFWVDLCGLVSSHTTPAMPVASVGPRFIGYFDNLNTLTGSMQVVRKLVGPDADFHILLPTTELTVLKDPLSFPPEVYPLTLVGELHSRTGGAYYQLNLPGASAEMFQYVRNLADPGQVQPGPRFGRKAASTCAAIGAGLGGGVAGCGAGLLTAGVGCLIFMPAAPLALLGLGVGFLGGGAAVGTVSALSAGEAVEKRFEKKDSDAAVEQARKANAAARR